MALAIAWGEPVARPTCGEVPTSAPLVAASLIAIGSLLPGDLREGDLREGIACDARLDSIPAAFETACAADDAATAPFFAMDCLPGPGEDAEPGLVADA